MGLFNFLTGGLALTNPVAAPALASPFSPPSSLESAIVGDFFGEVPNEVITPEIALRVPEVTRALQAHQALVAPLKFTVHHNDGEALTTQPAWVKNSDSGISPFIRWNGVVRDLFLFGMALVGAEVDSDTDLPRDLIHIPRNFWTISTEGSITVDDGISPRYRQRLIPIYLGSAGILTDGIDSVRQARKLELARQRRIDAPPPATELHLTDIRFDEMSSKEKEKLARDYASNRTKHSVAVTPSYIDVQDHSASDVDLFEAGMNSLRLQLAMHAGVPASFLEAGKEGGSSGEMTYTNENGKASELWVFGSARFAYAITARLSMDDVVGPDAEVRADLSDFMVPPPAQLSPETAVESALVQEDTQ